VGQTAANEIFTATAPHSVPSRCWEQNRGNLKVCQLQVPTQQVRQDMLRFILQLLFVAESNALITNSWNGHIYKQQSSLWLSTTQRQSGWKLHTFQTCTLN